MRSRDGNYRWFLSRALPIRDEHGDVTRWFGTHTDITERREAAEALRAAHANLEQLVAERTARLREMVGELEHFSYSITHDMRAPLRTMRGYSELLLAKAGPSLAPTQLDFLRRIVHGAARLDRLITDALRYSSAVRLEPDCAPLHLGPLLQGIIESYPPMQPPHAHIEIDPNLPAVIGNETSLVQCFSNLLANAIKFVPQNTTPHVRVRAEPRNGHIRLWVEDNGIGIPVDQQDRIWGMFERVHQHYEGTGIGLALVRKLVHRMGGQAGLLSQPGAGSRFWIELPAA